MTKKSSSLSMKKWREKVIPKRISQGFYGYCKVCKNPNKEGYGKRQFCSHACHAKDSHKKHPERNRVCRECAKEFVTNPAYIKRRTNAGLFCTRVCWNKFVSENKKGFVDGAGYLCVMHDGKRKRMHRVVVENFMKRELLPSEHVHHIDGNKLNNDISNLFLTDNSNHQKAHQSMEVLVYDLFKKGRVVFKDGIYQLS